MKLVRTEEGWENVKWGEHEVIFLDMYYRYGDAFNIKEQKAPIIAVRDYSDLKINNMTVYMIDGGCYAKNSKIIALGGTVRIDEEDDQTIVYPLDKNIGAIRWIKDRFEYVKAPEVMRFEDVAFISSQNEWDALTPGEFKVIAITDGGVELKSQKANHIVQLSGNVTVGEGVTLFAVGGRTNCIGGKVIGYDIIGLDPEDPGYTLKVNLIDGKVYQYGGKLRMIRGEFETPFLKELEIENQNIYSCNNTICIWTE